MIYKLTALLYFVDATAAKKAQALLIDHLKAAFTLTTGHLISDPSVVRLEKCHHDELTPRPCEVVSEVTTRA